MTRPGHWPAARASVTPVFTALVAALVMVGCDSGGGGGGGSKPVVELQALEAIAIEAQPRSASVRLTRTGETKRDLEVTLALGGASDPTRGSADAADYTLLTGGRPLAGDAVTIPVGAASIDIEVRPVADGSPEVPETLSLSVVDGRRYDLGATATESVQILDANNTVVNETLFIAALSAEAGADTLGSGYSVLRVRGDNDIATVELTFSNLTTVQSAVHIHIADPLSGPPVESLSLGQVTGHTWSLRASQFLTTDQELLDALHAGRLYVNVHSQRYPAGEIKGFYVRSTGSTTFTTPAPPPAITPLTGPDLDRDLARFLKQATFGPTPASLGALRQLVTASGGDRLAAMDAWIDQQMDLAQTPSASLYEITKATAPLFNANVVDKWNGWWTLACYGRDQLRQRVAFALGEILVTSDVDGRVRAYHYGHANYHDMLARGAFTSYRRLLEAVSLSPIMGLFLSHLRNQKERLDPNGQVIVSPDENYAREVMQLFAFGLLKLHPDGTVVLDANGLPVPTYDNDVITEMAQVFTGLGLSKRVTNGQLVDNTNFFLFGGDDDGTQARWLFPMIMFQAYHDESEKQLFDGHVIPAAQGGMTDLAQVHDLLVAHPSTAPFVAYRLIQRLVSSNPSRGYVYRVAKVFSDSGGDLGATIKAILLDYEARALELTDDIGAGRLQEPLVRHVALLRLLGAETNVPLSVLDGGGYPPSEAAKLEAGATFLRLGGLNRLGQIPLSAPSVFNFFRPSFGPAGPVAAAGLVAPEFQITIESQMYDFINYHHVLIFRTLGYPGGGFPAGYVNGDDDLLLDFTEPTNVWDQAISGGATEAEAAAALVGWLDLLLNGGGLASRYAQSPAPNPWSIVVEAVEESSAGARVKQAVYLLQNVPQSAVAR